MLISRLGILVHLWNKFYVVGVYLFKYDSLFLVLVCLYWMLISIQRCSSANSGANWCYQTISWSQPWSNGICNYCSRHWGSFRQWKSSKFDRYGNITLSVLRTFIFSVSCHFSCQKNIQLKFFCKIATFTYILLSFDIFGLDFWFFYVFKSKFLLEAGQILERSQWI